MFIAYAAAGILLALALSASATLTFTRNEAITVSMSKVGVPDSWLPRLASLKAAGAVGLLVGLAVPLIGSAAAGGVVLYFIGAIVAHVRAKDFEIAAPAILALLAAAALVLRVMSA
ncbi:DoxX family protein [Streptomyces sp. NPDC005181]|uniref:DoxX family protein n=1 Tax=Streptomyces sp. NPDC005181 TaxID=3156869 RepID=UPI0033ACBD90